MGDTSRLRGTCAKGANGRNRCRTIRRSSQFRCHQHPNCCEDLSRSASPGPTPPRQQWRALSGRPYGAREDTHRGGSVGAAVPAPSAAGVTRRRVQDGYQTKSRPLRRRCLRRAIPSAPSVASPAQAGGGRGTNAGPDDESALSVLKTAASLAASPLRSERYSFVPERLAMAAGAAACGWGRTTPGKPFASGSFMSGCIRDVAGRASLADQSVGPPTAEMDETTNSPHVATAAKNREAREAGA